MKSWISPVSPVCGWLTDLSESEVISRLFDMCEKLTN